MCSCFSESAWTVYVPLPRARLAANVLRPGSRKDWKWGPRHGTCACVAYNLGSGIGSTRRSEPCDSTLAFVTQLLSNSQHLLGAEMSHGGKSCDSHTAVLVPSSRVLFSEIQKICLQKLGILVKK